MIYGCWTKNRGFSPKMDGENNGSKPYENGWFGGGFPTIFGLTPIQSFGPKKAFRNSTTILYHIPTPKSTSNLNYPVSLEVQPPFFIGWFPNHHYFSRGLSSSKRNHHFLNGGWLPGFFLFTNKHRTFGISSIIPAVCWDNGVEDLTRCKDAVWRHQKKQHLAAGCRYTCTSMYIFHNISNYPPWN